jgi:hypothetical protein
MAWKLLYRGLLAQFTVWRLPRELLDSWKDVAAATAPLPGGSWYSANTAAAAMLAATLYAAMPEKARAQGGLHVTAVVDVRGGR